jgi:hypothetical protein
VSLNKAGNPTDLARRQQPARFTATIELHRPVDDDVAAGRAAFPNETHHLWRGGRRRAGQLEVCLERDSLVVAGHSPDALHSIF